MKPRATCPAPDCGKVLVVGPADTRARFPSHRHPLGRMCKMSGELVRLRHRVHPCKRCRALPTVDNVHGPEGDPEYDDGPLGPFRPPTPRRIKARGYCASHLREVDAEQRQRARDKYRQDTYGITAEQFARLVDAQGGGCACGSTHGRTLDTRTGRVLGLATDHDHDREAQCVAAGRHAEGTACKYCVRGALGRRCNTEIVGRFTPEQLRNLADYMERPTAQRLGWWDGEGT